MYTHILEPVDGSALGNLTLASAADLARRYGATLTLLHVVPPPVAGVFAEVAAYLYDLAEERGRPLEHGARLLDEARRRTGFPEAWVVCRETDGQPVATVIADEVGRAGADLMVMGTHGRTGLAHLLLGSVAEAVLRRARVPVLLVRAPAEVARGRSSRRPARDPPAEKPPHPRQGRDGVAGRVRALNGNAGEELRPTGTVQGFLYGFR